MTKLNCQIGDLAITVTAEISSNIGSIVRVVSPDKGQAGFSFGEKFGPCWYCECSHPMIWEFSGKSFSRLEGPIPDSYLQPIRPGGKATASGRGKARSKPIRIKLDIPQPTEFKLTEEVN